MSTRRHRRTGISPTLALMAGMALLPLAGLFDTAPGDGGGTGGTGSGGGGTEGGTAGGQAGGSGAGSGSGGTGTGTGAGGAQSGSQGSGTGGTAGSTGTPAQNVADLPEWAQSLIRTTRDEAAQNRVGKTAAEQARTELLKGLAGALGVDIGGAAPTAEQLGEQVRTLTSERDTARTGERALTVQLAAIPVAAKHGADVGALMDSASFLAKLGQLDPAANDFAAQLDTAVKAAVDANPRLKAGQAPARGGFDPNGGTNGDKPAASMEEAYARRFAPKS